MISALLSPAPVRGALRPELGRLGALAAGDTDDWVKLTGLLAGDFADDGPRYHVEALVRAWPLVGGAHPPPPPPLACPHAPPFTQTLHARQGRGAVHRRGVTDEGLADPCLVAPRSLTFAPRPPIRSIAPPDWRVPR